MFDKKGFVVFVGSNSGASYANGLDNIEKAYGIDIDAEIARDSCANLLTKIDADKKHMTDNDRKNRQNWYSHLRKYVEYCGKQPVEDQKKHFVSWFKQQPQRNQPGKLYADTTVNAAANLLQSGLQRLGVHGYENVNCFTITDVETFKKLHTACYAAATEFDKNAGFGDFGNGLDFYLQFLIETSSGTDNSEILKKIRFVIAHYKANFADVNKDERYKWEALHWYKQHWNINAPDFAAMLKNAFAKTFNLLNSGPNSLAYTQICQFSNDDPEGIRTAFSVLYNEAKPLDERIAFFRKVFQDRIKVIAQQNPEYTKKLSSYQDLHAISVYLAFEYPEKYFIYKASCYMRFIKRVGYEETSTAQNKSIRKLENLDQLSHIIIDIASEQPDLMALHKERLDASCYQDEALHLLAQDIMFYGSVYMPDEFFVSDEQTVLEGDEETVSKQTTIGLNTILYGPPGTGKTYHTVIYAVAIIENKKLEAVKAESYQDVLNRYNEYKAQGRIEFTTFHQSYGYEEFIEGIRPSVVDGDDTSNIQYSVQPGMFKKFCERAERPTSVQTSADDFGIAENAAIWKVSLARAGENEIRTDCLKNGYIRIGWEEYDGAASGSRIMNALINRMQIGDIVFSCYSASTIDAIGIVTGEYELREEYEDFRSFRTVNWLAKDFNEDIRAINGGKYMMQQTVHGLPNVSLSDVYRLIEKHQSAEPVYIQNKQNYVFIIDEINRGNISKIFGELITLIEESKRVGKEEGMKTLLPYSVKPFGVPENVYIIGTMNTADRSIATIDTALRRRFEFKEMLPDPDVVAKISVGNLSIKTMLEQINRRIAVLYDREHTIGHAYFMPLAKDNSMEKLAEIFKNKVIPLLQEYFYEDYEKIRLVLGDNQKKDEQNQFIQRTPIKHNELFGSADVGIDEGYTYEINKAAFMSPEAYLQI